MEPMGIVAWVVVGAIAGWLASRVIPSQMGFVGDSVVGMVGALVGGFLFEAFGSIGATGFNVWSIFVAFSGAVILLFLLRVLTRLSGSARR